MIAANHLIVGEPLLSNSSITECDTTRKRGEAEPKWHDNMVATFFLLIAIRRCEQLCTWDMPTASLSCLHSANPCSFAHFSAFA